MERNIALLIDFENIAAGTEKEGLGRFEIDKVIDRIKDKGRILIARSYADWGRFARFKQGLLSANVTMYELTSHGMQDKNRADIAMVVDCLDLAYTRTYIDTFVVVSGDSDFTPLVLKLREMNKTVIGLGTRKSTSRLIINACDEFIFYDTIVQTKARTRSRPSEKVPKDRAKVLDLLAEVLEGMQREDPTPPHASVLKSALLRRQPDFNENDLGFGSFARFLEFARDEGVVELARDPKAGGYTVDATEDDEDEARPERAAPAARGAGGRDGGYDDPYFPPGADGLVSNLNKAGLTALSYPTRLAVLEQLVELADGGKGRKRRRVNIPFAQEELAKRLRRTHPDLKPTHIRNVLRALLQAGMLMHKDGSSIRNATAQFEIHAGAPKLNQGLVEVYLRHFRDSGVALDDTALLAAFLFGDAERTRDVETTLAWLDAPRADDDDALLEVDDGDDQGGSKAASVDLGDDLDALLVSDDDDDALLVSDDDAPADDAPKKRKRKRSPKKKEAEASDAEPKPEPEPEQDETTEEAPAAAVDEMDALLAVDDEEPKPKTRRRKKTDDADA